MSLDIDKPDTDVLPDAVAVSPPLGEGSAGEAVSSKTKASTFKGFIFRVKHFVGLDRSIAWTIAARGWSSVGGLVSVFLVVRFLTPAEQGFYYTFGSVVAAQIFFELGLTSVLLHTASHEGGHLYWEDKLLLGMEVPLGRVSTLFQRAVLWYSVAAVLVVLCLAPGGYYFFLKHQGTHTQIAWQFPWLLLVIGTSVNLLLSPAVTLFEGIGLVSEVARVRFCQAIASSLLLWSILIAKKGLLAAAAGVWAQACVVLLWLGLSKREAIISLLRLRPAPHARISWGKEVWPFQWRIAISWLSGYFISQAFNPIVFAYCGPVEAGRMGMSLTICTAILVMGLSWVNTKAAPFGQWIARKDYALLDKVFFRALLQSSVLVGALYLCFGLVILFAQRAGLPLANRVLPIGALVFVLIASLLNHFVNAEAVYLRSHKKEVLMPSAVLGGITTLLLSRFLAPRLGTQGVSLGYLISTVFFGFGLVNYLFFKYRKLWHQTP